MDRFVLLLILTLFVFNCLISSLFLDSSEPGNYFFSNRDTVIFTTDVNISSAHPLAVRKYWCRRARVVRAIRDRIWCGWRCCRRLALTVSPLCLGPFPAISKYFVCGFFDDVRARDRYGVRTCLHFFMK